MTKIIDTNMGKVATSPSSDNDGQYSDLISYKRYEMCLYDYDSWVSKKDGNKGHTPADGSPWWFRATKGGKYARQVADQAVSKANAATALAENVNAALSTQQGAVLLTVTNRNGVSVTKDVGWRIYRTYATMAAMDADAANVEEGKFTMITSDVEDPDNAKMYVRSGYPAGDPSEQSPRKRNRNSKSSLPRSECLPQKLLPPSPASEFIFRHGDHRYYTQPSGRTRRQYRLSSHGPARFQRIRKASES